MTRPGFERRPGAVPDITLAEFLLARLDEDEQVAREASEEGASWSTGGSKGLPGAGVYSTDGDPSMPVVYDEGRPLWGQATHIARHDPARVLAEVEAKRRIVDEYQETRDEAPLGDRYTGQLEALERVVRLLALPYADHPDYRKEWRP